MKEINCDGLELRSSSGPLESALVRLGLGDEESTATGSFRPVEVESAGLHECKPGDDLMIWNTKDNKSELHFTLEKCDYDFMTNISLMQGRTK